MPESVVPERSLSEVGFVDFPKGKVKYVVDSVPEAQEACMATPPIKRARCHYVYSPIALPDVVRESGPAIQSNASVDFSSTA